MAIQDGNPSIMFGIPSVLGNECVELGQWLWNCAYWLGVNKAADVVTYATQKSSRILLNRNSLVEAAIRARADYLLMVDPDMVPDMYCGQRVTGDGESTDRQEDSLPGQRPFLPVALEIFKSNPFSVVAAPACGDPPKRKLNVYPIVPDGEATSATHEYAFKRVREGAVEQVAAIGTGLIIIPLPVLFALKRPYFDDVYNVDKTVLEKSQDVYFTNCLHQAGVQVFCTWCSFAGHRKTVTLGCPEIDRAWREDGMQQPQSASVRGDESQFDISPEDAERLSSFLNGK